MRTISISIIFLFLSIHLPAAFAYNGLVNGDLLVEDAADVTEGVDIVTQALPAMESEAKAGSPQ